MFIDSANIKEINEALEMGIVKGITTNPSILAKEPKTEFKKHIEKIVDVIHKYDKNIHLSLEFFNSNLREIELQAEDLRNNFDIPGLSIKVHIGFDTLSIIKRLSNDGFSVNCTCCMSVAQAMMASAAGAKYVSLFWGRIRDGGKDIKKDEMIREGVLTEDDFNPSAVVSAVKKIFSEERHNTSELIVGSIRSVSDIVEAAKSGADIVTIPPKFFKPMIHHFKTEEVVSQFIKDFKLWME